MLIPSFATYLKYFSDVVALKSFSKAAKRNFISQSAMSQAIKRLEERSGHTLIHHARNTFDVTPEGKLLYDRVQELMDHFEALEHFFDDLKGMKKVHFGCMHSLALAILPKVIRAFKRKFPHAEISFELGNGAYIKRLVRRGEVDFGLVLDYDDLIDCYTEELHKGRYEVYRAKRCLSEGLLISDQSEEAQWFIKKYVKAYKREPQIEMRVASWEVIARLTEMGVGQGYFPDYLTTHYKGVEPIVYPFASIPYTLVAAFKSKRYVTEHARSFIEMLVSHF